MKHILLCTDGSLFAQESYHHAAWLAPRLDACVDVLYVTDVRSQKSIETGNLSGSIGIDAAQSLLEKLVELEHEKAKINHERAKHILQDAEEKLLSEGVKEVNTIHETGFLVDSLHELEVNADLIILGKRGENAPFASDHLGGNTDRIIRGSHKPCLVTAKQFKPIQRLLFAYDGSKSCQKMLQFLVDSPAFKGLELHILTVAKNSHDQKAEKRNQEALEKATAGGFEPIGQILEGDPERIITSYAEGHDISLIVMGAYGHSRIRRLVIGSTTIQVLRSTTIPVLLFR
ncbi:MAG: universal stress protein [Kamptonema sp. SIO4C4]|nr:universal stress protein [Kamptonema sp. SIO4C4]